MISINIFKKSTKKKIVVTNERLDKKQLEKVIGGADDSQAGKALYGSASSGKTV